MNKSQELEAARNLEPGCDYGAVGAGRYRVLNELRRNLDSGEGPVDHEYQPRVPAPTLAEETRSA